MKDNTIFSNIYKNNCTNLFVNKPVNDCGSSTIQTRQSKRFHTEQSTITISDQLLMETSKTNVREIRWELSITLKKYNLIIINTKRYIISLFNSLFIAFQQYILTGNWCLHIFWSDLPALFVVDKTGILKLKALNSSILSKWQANYLEKCTVKKQHLFNFVMYLCQNKWRYIIQYRP